MKSGIYADTTDPLQCSVAPELMESKHYGPIINIHVPELWHVDVIAGAIHSLKQSKNGAPLPLKQDQPRIAPHETATSSVEVMLLHGCSKQRFSIEWSQCAHLSTTL